jgi:hypothetical protein
VLDQVRAGRGIGLDRAGGGDVVGRDRVAEHDEAARALDVRQRLRARRHVLEVGRAPHIGRVGLPVEELAFRHGQLAPLVVAGEDVRVRGAEHLAAHGGGDRLLDLGCARPEVAKVDVVSVLVLAERLLEQIEVHPARQRVGDDERR